MTRQSWLCIACAVAAMGIAPAQTAVEHVIHTFGNFTKGALPCGTLVRDTAGNLYGTTYQGGAGHGANIRTQVRQLASKYSDIVIDVGGRDTGSLRAALTVADVVLIPVKPRSFDLWGVDQTADLVKEAREINDRLRAITVLNEADPQGKDNQAASDALREVQGIELAPVQIVRRKAFPNAAAAGLSVLEYDDPKAIEEFRHLTEFLFVHTSDNGKVAYGNR